MGLSEEDKKKHPYLIKKEFDRATDAPEFIEANKAFERALFEYLYQNLLANFKAHKEKPSTVRVIRGTLEITDQMARGVLRRLLPLLIEKMLQKFDLLEK